jgi:septum formation protein
VKPRLVLASASPRRAQILRALGVPFRVVVAAVDESLWPDEPPQAAAERLARAKAEAVARSQALPVLAADTLVVSQGRTLGKPASPADAAAMLRALAGETHDVVTGVALVHGGRTCSGAERTEVRFAPLSPAEIAWYVATGEPDDKAGGYHVDGRGGLFIEAVHGSPSNVAGLPVRLVLELAREAGVDIGLPRSGVPHGPVNP